MLVQDYFRRMPEAVLRQIEGNMADFCGERKQEIAELLASEPFLANMVSSLPDRPRRTLEYIVKRMGLSPFGMEELEKTSAPDMAGAELSAGLCYLCRTGLVIALRKLWGERLFVIPDNLFRPLHEIIVGRDRPAPFEDDEKIGDRHAGRGLAYELFFFLCYLARHKVETTQKGAIPKRHLRKISAIIELEEQPLQPFVPAPLKELYPPSVAVLCDLALKLGLIEQKDGTWCLQHSNLLRLFPMTPQQLNALLYRIWSRTHMPKDPRIQHFLLLLERLPQGQWFPLQGIVRFLQTHGIILDEDDSLADWMRRWTGALSAFGWGEAGVAHGMDVFRLTAGLNSGVAETTDPAEAKCIVQSDFEIIVPPNAPFGVRWELECIAEHRKTDQVSIYALTKESIAWAGETGRNAETCIGFLRKNSLYEIPEHVILGIETWAAQTNRVYFAHVTVLRCRNADAAAQIRRCAECRPYLIASLGDSDFIVDEERIGELTGLLSRLDLPPERRFHTAKAGRMISEAHIPEWDPDRALPLDADSGGYQAKGMIIPAVSFPEYEPETRLPSVEEMFPQWKRLPRIWLQQCRSYHASTQKQIIEQAIAWKTLIRLRKQGHDYTVIPIEIEGNSERFRLIGRTASEEIRWTPENWEGIQLLLPGINDGVSELSVDKQVRFTNR